MSLAQGSLAWDRRGGPASRVSMLLPLAAAALVGAGIGSGSPVGFLLLAASCGGFALALPVVWLATLTVAASITFRALVPSGTGALSVAPDAFLALTVVKIGALAAVGRTGRPLALSKRLALPLAALIILACASKVSNVQPTASLVASLRQFARYPVWALALCGYGLSWREGRRLLTVVLAGSLVQLPLALYQTVRPVANPLRDVQFFPGDNVSGTFGLGGSNTEMVFLVLCALAWLALVLHRQLPAWILWLLAPVLVLPMALGSAAVFLILLPAAVIGLLVRSALARSTPGIWGALAGGLLLVGVGAYAASSLALAPGFAGSAQRSASSIFDLGYLARYVNDTGDVGQHTRLGFMRLAVDTDLQDGLDGIVLGQGPTAAAIGEPGLQVGPRRISVLARSSVQSVPRLILGFGFGGLAAYLVIVLLPLAGLGRRPPVDGVAWSLRTMLPVAAAVYLIAAVYNSPWTDPGIGATFWTLVVVTYAGLEERGEESAG